MLIRAYSDSSPRCSTLAIVLAIALHIGIDITPPPNNIAAFSHEAALRYFWFAPYGVSMAVNELRALPVVGGLYAAVGASCLALTIAVQQPDVWASWTRAPVESLVSLEIHSVDWYVAAHTAFSALLLRGLCLGEAAEPAGGKPPAARASAKRSCCPAPVALADAASGAREYGALPNVGVWRCGVRSDRDQFAEHVLKPSHARRHQPSSRRADVTAPPVALRGVQCERRSVQRRHRAR